LSLIPYAACRLPSAVHLSPRLQRGVQPLCTAATAAALALQKRVCLAERDLHHGGPACTLSSSLGGRLKCCCYCDCCRSPAPSSSDPSSSDPSSSFPVCCKYFPTSHEPIMSFRCLDVSMMSPIIARRNNTCSKPLTLIKRSGSEIEMTARRRAWASESERRTAVLLAILKYRGIISFACEESRIPGGSTQLVEFSIEKKEKVAAWTP
jgi:hypothetical protein